MRPAGEPVRPLVYRPGWLADERHGLVYCPIPKCACTTLKFWFASNAEGARPDTPPGAIHRYVQQRYGMKRLARDEAEALLDRSVSFVVLRDPAERLVASFAGKLVYPHRDLPHGAGKTVIEACVRSERGSLELDTEHPAYNGVERVMLRASSSIDYAAGVSLRRVVSMIESLPDELIEPHFRPQQWFVAGYRFDVWGTLDTLRSTIAEAAARTGSSEPLPESRATRSSSTEGPSGVCFADEPSGSLHNRGIRPTVSNMLDDDLKARIRERFAADYAMLARAQQAACTRYDRGDP